MKKVFLLFLITSLFSCQQSNDSTNQKIESAYANRQMDSDDSTNNFYDNEKLYDLKVDEIEISGEIIHPGIINTSQLPVRSIIVKETLPAKVGNTFVGAFRYDGYSLFDLLNAHTPNKINREVFPPIIDLYVIIENAKGEKAVFSWGEIYYANHLHEIIIANKVMRIVPSKTNELWPLPTNAKIVVGSDLLTSRNIENPVKITVKSATREFEIEKGMSPMFAPGIDVFVEDELSFSINKPNENLKTHSYESIFYGRGRGIHSTIPFDGQMMREVLSGQIPLSEETLRESYLIFAAKDGYRGIFTYSEIFNRNDQAELLLIYMPENNDGGAFRLFPPSDFFSDRAISSLNRIYFDKL